MKYLKGSGVRPIYKKLLIAAVVIYVVGTCIMLSDLCYRLGAVEHRLSDASCEGHNHK